MSTTESLPARICAMSAQGRYVAICKSDRLDVVDALGTDPRRTLPVAALVDFTWVGEQLWVVAGGQLRRYTTARPTPAEVPAPTPSGAQLHALPAVDLAPGPGRLVPAASGLGHCALWRGERHPGARDNRYLDDQKPGDRHPGDRHRGERHPGDRHLLIRDIDDEVTVHDLAEEVADSSYVGLLGGRRLALATGSRLRLRDAGSRDVLSANLPDAGRVTACHYVFGERALAVLMEAVDSSCLVILRSGGQVIHRVALPRVAMYAIAPSRGRALIHAPDEGRLVSVDLRYGRILAGVEPPLAMRGLAVDADARYVTLAGYYDTGDASTPPDGTDKPGGDAADAPVAVLHCPYAQLFAGGARPTSPSLSSDAPPAPDQPGSGANSASGSAADKRPLIDAGADTGPDAGADTGPDAGADTGPDAGADAQSDTEADGAATATPRPRPKPVVIPRGPLRALGPVPVAPEHLPPVAAKPFASAREFVHAMIGLIGLYAQHAIALAWDTGVLGDPKNDTLPHEHEVYGTAGMLSGLAPQELAGAHITMKDTESQVNQRISATRAAGVAMPFLELCLELGLNQTEGMVLFAVAAPQFRPEIARLYRILAGDPKRAACDRHLIEQVLGRGDRQRCAEIGRALADTAPLVDLGLITVGIAPNGLYSLAPLTAHEALIERLLDRGAALIAATPFMNLVTASHTLEAMCLPAELKRDLALALAEAAPDGRPVRVLLRGRRGSGRRTLAAALAHRVGRPVAVIHCERLAQRRGATLAAAVLDELRRAVICGAVACLSGLEALEHAGTETQEHLRWALRIHPAPIIIRASAELKPPLEPGYLSFTIPLLNETERLAWWRQVLQQQGLQAREVARLAARYRVGAGTIYNAASTVADTLVNNMANTTASADPGHSDQPPDADAAPENRDTAASQDATAALDTVMGQHIEFRMGRMATRITRLSNWDQVALPEEVRAGIEEFIARVRYRRMVYEGWGYDSRMTTARGLTALFYGPPGVGKTLVAGLIANQLGLELYRVDLARVTSKWIGETEKNLAEVFDASEDGQVVILFDEADALFASRTAVESSRDRHANQEVNYLLQRFDTFDGVAILTTNREGAIDRAFQRRMSLRLAFPFPDEELRTRLWQAHIPADMPIERPLQLDHLARQYPLSGGYIRNCALRAAFLAAVDGKPLSRQYLERAIELEYQDMGKLVPGGRLE